jgi:hypothetical protein
MDGEGIAQNARLEHGTLKEQAGFFGGGVD